MRIDIISIFPDMFEAVLGESIVKRAREKKAVDIRVHDLRDFTQDKHRKVDDRPFGGGSGMVICAQPLFDAVSKIKGKTGKKAKVVLLCPQGKTFDQATAKRLAKEKQLIFICGHYEGIDERVRENLADEEISIGDYVLTGGELPAMVVIDAVVRLLPGVLGDKNSLKFESFEGNLLEYPGRLFFGVSRSRRSYCAGTIRRSRPGVKPRRWKEPKPEGRIYYQLKKPEGVRQWIRSK